MQDMFNLHHTLQQRYKQLCLIHTSSHLERLILKKCAKGLGNVAVLFSPAPHENDVVDDGH